MTDSSLQSNLPLWKQSRQARSKLSSGDQFDRFQSLEIDDCDIPNSFHYCTEKGKNVRWSEIEAMSFTIHSIPAMLAEVE